ncbi:MAG: RNA polymerase sigma factor, partial [Gemmataceae bacterium]
MTQTILGWLYRAADRGGPSPHDAELLEGYVNGRDARAFEALVWRHAPGVWAACRRVLRHDQDAEDAFQGVWVVLALKAGGIGKRESLGPWLHRVAVRLALRARQRRSRLPITADVEPAAAPAVDAGLSERLDAEVDRLPEKHRRAFVLCHLEGLTLEEAGAALGCPPATVGTWVARAKQRLRERLPAPLAVAPLAVADALVPAAVRAALNPGAAPGPVLFLVKGVLNAMFYEKVRTVTAALAAVALVVASGVGLAQAGKPAAAEKPAEKEAAARTPEPGESAQAKLMAVESAHYLARYGELLRETRTIRSDLREAQRNEDRRAMEREIHRLKETESELGEVRERFQVLEKERHRLGLTGANDPAASPVLER